MILNTERDMKIYFKDNVPHVQQTEKQEPTPAPAYLEKKANVKKPVIRQIFTIEDTNEFRVIDDPIPKLDPDLSKMQQLTELAILLGESLTPHYEAVNRSLKTTSEYEYANHDMPNHIFPTMLKALYFIDRSATAGNSKVTDDSRTAVVLAAAFHDLGNMLSRDNQTDLALILTQKIAPWLHKKYPKLEEEVNQAIQHHSYRQIVEKVQSGEWGANADDVIKKMAKVLPPSALALILADKIDRGRHRVEGKRMTKHAFDSIPHASLNYFFQTRDQGTGISQGNDTFAWNINYTPSITKIEQNNYHNFAKSAKLSNRNGLAYVPESIRISQKKKKRSYFELFQKELWQVSYDKIFSTAMTAFALNPDMQEFKLVIHKMPSTDLNPDKNDYRQRSQNKEDKSQKATYTLKRGKVQNGIDKIMRRYKIEKSNEGSIF